MLAIAAVASSMRCAAVSNASTSSFVAAAAAVIVSVRPPPPLNAFMTPVMPRDRPPSFPANVPRRLAAASIFLPYACIAVLSALLSELAAFSKL